MNRALLSALRALDRVSAAAIIDEHVRSHGPLAVVDQMIAPSLETLGGEWDRGQTSLAQVYVAARISDELTTPIFRMGIEPRPDHPRIAIAVLEDSHALGKRIVSAVLRAAGANPRDYGAGLAAEELFDRAANDGVDVLMVSALMLRSALEVRRVVDGLRSRGFRGRVVVGGAPFRMDAELWKQVGADAMGRTASDALSAIGVTARGAA